MKESIKVNSLVFPRSKSIVVPRLLDITREKAFIAFHLPLIRVVKGQGNN